MIIVSLLFLAFCFSKHSNNWAIIVSTSKYWFNYRHAANALSIYNIVKKNGIPDDQIILMLADDASCDGRNIYQTKIFSEEGGKNLYNEDIEVDYKDEEVTVENFIRILTGRHHPDTPSSKRLRTDSSSNILIYLSGHGGENFFKFRDKEEIQSEDLADAFKQMEIQKRYNEILLIVDTCEAYSLFKALHSPNIIAIASSDVGENSYSYGYGSKIGNTLSDRFTHFTLKYFEKLRNMNEKLINMFEHVRKQDLQSTAKINIYEFRRGIKNVLLTDFFGSNVKCIPTEEIIKKRGNLDDLGNFKKKKVSIPIEEGHNGLGEKDVEEFKKDVKKSEKTCYLIEKSLLLSGFVPFVATVVFTAIFFDARLEN